MSNKRTSSAARTLTGRPPQPPKTNAVQGFLDAIDPYTYKYKDPANEPTDTPTGSDYLGVMAQDVEKAPTGNTLVKQDAQGTKHLEMGAMISALAAASGYMHNRIKVLEAGKGNSSKAKPNK